MSNPPIHVLVTNFPPTQSFDWTTFLWGGALGTFLGAFIILGIEKIFDFLWTRYKFSQEKKQITFAFETEIHSNIKICDAIVEELSKDHNKNKIFEFTKLNVTWMNKYCDKFIDFTNTDSLRLYSFIYGAKTLIERIDNFSGSLRNLQASSARALIGFDSIISTHNQNVLQIAESLKKVLETIKKLKKDNKIFDSEVLREQFPDISISLKK